MRGLVALSLLTACHAAGGSVPSESRPAQVSQPYAVTCVLKATTAVPPTLSAELLRLGPQYFHPAHRGVFNDLMAGTSTYAFYDPRDPVRVDPPTGIQRVEAVTDGYIVGWGHGGLWVAPRRGGVATRLVGSERLALGDAVVSPNGLVSIVAYKADSYPPGQTSELPITLFRADNSSPPRVVANARTLSRDAPRASVSGGVTGGVTGSGSIAIVWVEPADAGRLRLVLAWVDSSGQETPTQEIDSVLLPESYARLSLLTGFDLAVTPHGEGVAVAWRVLRAVEPLLETGSASAPPDTPFPAELRIVVATPTSANLASTFPGQALALGGTSGVGPWSLAPSSVLGARFGARAAFFWYDNTRRNALVGAFPGDAAPTELVAHSSPSLLVSRRSARAGLEILSYDSTRPLIDYAISCDAAPSSTTQDK